MKITSTNPSRNYEVIGEVEAATEQEVIDAVAQARAAQPAWSGLTQAERNQAVESLLVAIDSHGAELAELMSKEMGKPIIQARAQIAENAEQLRKHIEIAEQSLASEV